MLVLHFENATFGAILTSSGRVGSGRVSILLVIGRSGRIELQKWTCWHLWRRRISLQDDKMYFKRKINRQMQNSKKKLFVPTTMSRSSTDGCY